MPEAAGSYEYLSNMYGQYYEVVEGNFYAYK